MNKGIKIYFLNCFLLILPLLAWNLALTDQLPSPFKPEVFGQNIPWFITLGENTFRTLIFLLTALMPLSIKSTQQKRGGILYLTGTLLYFLSWLALIYFPDSAWSNSRLGFLAPAYTPLLWLTGIGFISNYLSSDGFLWLAPCFSFFSMRVTH